MGVILILGIVSESVNNTSRSGAEGDGFVFAEGLLDFEEAGNAIIGGGVGGEEAAEHLLRKGVDNWPVVGVPCSCCS